MRDRERPNRVRRHPERGRYDRASVNSVLDGVLFGHVAFVDGGQPYCIPMLQARVGDTVYVHGSSASRTLRLLGAGVPACLTVTAIDGLVLARSAFEHSANYRSAVLLGAFRRIEGAAEQLAALEAFANKLVPGRWDEVRPPSERELKATAIVGLPIDQAAVKVRTGGPTDDDSADADRNTWAGVVPITTRFGEPEPSAGLRAGIALAASVRRLVARDGDRVDG
jgi:nitroimidazol reductase NimA-like FMN-containing flavoprotein (pyridoxamine 5'-phosphate oxidase superfamily)